jgi:hypothetical protein
VRHPRAALDVGRHPVVGRGEHERRPGFGHGLEAGGQRLRGHPVGHPQALVVLWRDPVGRAAAQHQATDQGGVRVALRQHVLPGPGQRQAQGVVALGRAVGEKPGPLCAVGLGGQDLRLVVRGGPGPEVDPRHRLVDIEGQRLADGPAQAGVGPRPALVPGDMKPGRPPEAVGGERVQIRRALLAPRERRPGGRRVRPAHLAACSR